MRDTRLSSDSIVPSRASRGWILESFERTLKWVSRKFPWHGGSRRCRWGAGRRAGRRVRNRRRRVATHVRHGDQERGRAGIHRVHLLLPKADAVASRARRAAVRRAGRQPAWIARDGRRRPALVDAHGHQVPAAPAVARTGPVLARGRPGSVTSVSAAAVTLRTVYVSVTPAGVPGLSVIFIPESPGLRATRTLGLSRTFVSLPVGSGGLRSSRSGSTLFRGGATLSGLKTTKRARPAERDGPSRGRERDEVDNQGGFR